MSFLSKIGAAISSMLSRSAAPSIDKTAVLTMIDGNIVAFDGFDRIAGGDAERQRKLYTALTQGAGGDPKTAKVLAAAYTRFSQHLDYKIKNSEAKRFLSGLSTAVRLFRRDHEEIKERFEDLFGTDTPSLSLDEVRTVHAVILGYLERVRRAMEWINLVIGLIDVPEGTHPPGYMLEVIANNTDKVAATFNTAARRGTITLLSEIERMKRAGGDVFVITDGSTLDHYARDSEFRGVEDEMLGMIGNPILLIHGLVASWARMFYDWNVETREWITARMSLLQLQMQSVDPASPEYQRALTIYQKYTQQLAVLEEKIRRYEHP